MTPKEECEVLMDELIKIALNFLNKSEEFYPFGGVMKTNGIVEYVAFHDGKEFPSSEDVKMGLIEALHQRALDCEIKATGIVWDATKVLCPDNTKSDAVIINLEHCDDYSVSVVYPYKKTFFRKIKWKAPFAGLGDKNIFP